MSVRSYRNLAHDEQFVNSAAEVVHDLERNRDDDVVSLSLHVLPFNSRS